MSKQTARCGLVVAMLTAGLVPLVQAHASTPNAYQDYTLGTTGGEPSLGWDPHYNSGQGAVLYGAGLHVQRVTWDDTQTPATISTTTVTPPAVVTSLDSITVVDQNTHRTFSSQLLAACSRMSYSDDAGATWNQSTGCGAGTLLDHQTIGSGPVHAPVTPINGNDAAYYCAQNGYSEVCAASVDGGVTFPIANAATNGAGTDVDPANPQFTATGGSCAGLTGHVRVAPNGTAYVPVKGCEGTPSAASPTNYEYFGGHPALSVSANNGASWSIHAVPDGNNPNLSDPSVGIGRDNTVYFAYHDGISPTEFTDGPTSSAKVAVSHDNGGTFDASVNVTPPGVNNIMFPQVIAGDGDRAAVAFLGTTATGDDQTNAFTGSWDMYVAATYDRGVTWTTVDATPGHPVQRGCIDMQGTPNPPQRTDICSQRNMLDFNDITVDTQGRAIIAYSRGCSYACGADPTQQHSTGNADYVLRQSSGRGLYAAYDGVLPGSQPDAVFAEFPFAAVLPVAALVAVAAGTAARRRRASEVR